MKLLGVPVVLKEIVDSLDKDLNQVIAFPLLLLMAYGALRITSSMFNELGVISGHDLTTEAAVTKLMSVLANSDNPKEDLGRNLRGEMTID